MTQATVAPVRGSVTVQAPIDRAFKVFTDQLATWWPAEYHIGEADYQTAVLEPRQGGRWYEKGTDGSECDWGQVLAWDPPRRVVLSWQITPRALLDAVTDPDRAAAKRAFEAMMGMGKIDIAAIETARRGGSRA